MLFALFVLAARPHSGTITLSVPVGRADRAIAALGRAAGVRMTATEPVASETVFLKIENRPLAETMGAIAHTMCGEWRKRPDGTYTLGRSASKTAGEIRRETARKRAILEAWRRDFLRNLNFDYTSATLKRLVREKLSLEASRSDERLSEPERRRRLEREIRLDEVDPASRALARCLRGLDLRSVAALEPQTAIVFSSRPNARQKSLPSTESAARKTLAREQAMWGRAVRGMPKPKASYGDRSESWSRLEPYEVPTVALVEAACEQDDCYAFHLKLATNRGDLVAEREYPDIWTTPHKTDFPHPKRRLPAPKPGPETRALLFRVKQDGPSVLPAIQTLKPFFDDPVGHDFLRLGNQELLTALANDRRKSVVACLPDAASATFLDTLSLDEFVAGGGLGEWQVDESKPVIEVRPRRWAVHWHHRADRQVLATFIRSYRTAGRFDLRALLRLARTTGLEDRSPASLFAQLADPEFRMSYA